MQQNECGEEVEIQALPIAECSSVINEVDIVLLGPQVRFQKPQVEKLSKWKNTSRSNRYETIWNYGWKRNT